MNYWTIIIYIITGILLELYVLFVFTYFNGKLVICIDKCYAYYVHTILLVLAILTDSISAQDLWNENKIQFNSIQTFTCTDYCLFSVYPFFD
jgi:hypothetical protein